MMKSYKHLLMSVACATFMLGNFAAFAAEEAGTNEFSSKISSGENVVLFKVHDIIPLKNEDGVVTDCEFGLTLYNRSPKSIDSATMTLSWLDEGVAEVIQEETKRSQGQVNSLTQAKQPKTSDVVSKDLTTSVILPQIKPFRQVSLKSKLKSDRCFLMMEEAKISFTACHVTAAESNDTNKRLASIRSTGGGEDCQALFRFVSPRDPEYYREFRKVSFNEEASLREENRKKDVDEIDANHKKVIDALNKAAKALNSITGDTEDTKETK